ncbi:hypothetical protein [Egicoccus sp. AB-alg6-2]|uniref:hypothetical protein n=1 Tax=Egicoccus sp. AB-alg6-2 TaxID=3242692 RepID=UPI00359EB348
MRHLVRSGVVGLAAVTVACGGPVSPTIESRSHDTRADVDAFGQVGVADSPLECHRVAPLEVSLAEGVEPTGSNARWHADIATSGDAVDAPGSETELRRWGSEEVPEQYAGTWLDAEHRVHVVAFTADVAANADIIRHRFASGLAVARATNTLQELEQVHHDVAAEVDRSRRTGNSSAEPFDDLGGEAGLRPEPGTVRWADLDLPRNRVAIGLYEPTDEHVADLAERFGPERVCVVLEHAPAHETREPPGWVPEADAYERPDTADDPDIAPWCEDVPPPPVEAPAGIAGPPTTAAPVDDIDGVDGVEHHLRQEPGDPTAWMLDLEEWGTGEAADGYAGLWYDAHLDTFVVGFAGDTDAWATVLHERFHPGFAVAQVHHTWTELLGLLGRLEAELRATGGQEPASGQLLSTGLRPNINRVTVGLFTPDPDRLAELSGVHGVDAICFATTSPGYPLGR